MIKYSYGNGYYSTIFEAVASVCPPGYNSQYFSVVFVPEPKSHLWCWGPNLSPNVKVLENQTLSVIYDDSELNVIPTVKDGILLGWQAGIPLILVACILFIKKAIKV